MRIEVGREIYYCYRDTQVLLLKVNEKDLEITCPDVDEFCEIERARSMCKD